MRRRDLECVGARLEDPAALSRADAQSGQGRGSTHSTVPHAMGPTSRARTRGRPCSTRSRTQPSRRYRLSVGGGQRCARHHWQFGDMAPVPGLTRTTSPTSRHSCAESSLRSVFDNDNRRGEASHDPRTFAGRSFRHVHQHDHASTGPDQDPVCGMDREARVSYRAIHAGHGTGSAVPSAKASSKAIPRYLTPQKDPGFAESAPAPAPNTPARCIRKSRQIRPGTCPKCGMTLEPVMPGLGTTTIRARRFPPPVLVDAAADGDRHRDRDVRRSLRFDAGDTRPGSNWPWRRRSCCGPAGRSSCALPVDRQPQPEHVDADRAGHRRPMRTACRHRRAGVFPACSGMGEHVAVLRGGRGDHLADLLGQVLELKARLGNRRRDQGNCSALRPRPRGRIARMAAEEDIPLTHVHPGDRLRIRPAKGARRWRVRCRRRAARWMNPC